MSLTFSFAEGFLEDPDEIQKDAIKLAKLVTVWWRTPFQDDYYNQVQEEMVRLAQKILEKENDTTNILR